MTAEERHRLWLTRDTAERPFHDDGLNDAWQGLLGALRRRAAHEATTLTREQQLEQMRRELEGP